MVDNKDKNGTPDDFSDDFDVEDFNESDFDEAAFDDSEIAGLPDEEFADEDFADEEWQESDAQNKKLLTSGEKKGLSFNTMVMIGAFVVGGGVLALNIMSKSSKQAAGEGGGIFQSMLDISGVMDGDLFGAKDAEKTPEELAAQQQQTQTEGFLNNPDAVIPSDANPPQPTPIAPPDEEPVMNSMMPLPEDETATPRAPEDGMPESKVAIAETPIGQPEAQDGGKATPSAEDILKQAMANREQKAAQETPALPVEMPSAEDENADPADMAREPALEVAQEEPARVEEIAEAPTAPVPVTPPTPAATPEAVAQNAEALGALDGRLQDVLKRMEQIESELGSVKTAKQTDTEGLQKTIESLKAEIAELKRRPVAAQSPAKVAKLEVDEPEPAVEEQPAPRKKSAPKKPKPAAKVATATPASSGRWELRAAQPGRAWVSKPGERDMQSVEVGQTISGIGRVTGILYQNGRWTVQGTQGQINQ